MKGIERVVLVHRLREVVAQVGFTRFEAARPTLKANWKWAFAAPPWPARSLGCQRSRTRAKASFCNFARSDIETWLNTARGAKTWPAVAGRLRVLEKRASGNASRVLPACRISCFIPSLTCSSRAVSLECGYPASSIRERIYALAIVSATESFSTRERPTPRERLGG